MEESLPKNISEVIAMIDAEWSALMNVIKKLSPERMDKIDEGGWSPKDNLAHLMEWMKVLIYNNLGGQPVHEVLGISREVAEQWNYDALNKILFERHHQRPAQDVLADTKQAYNDLLKKLNSMTIEDLMMPRFPDDPEKRPYLAWVRGNSFEHFAEHRINIEKLL
jgi:hypothetical protein